MALIVEDGTGKPNADSYVSVADCITYHANYTVNPAFAAAASNVQEAALRAATQYLDSRYRYPGTRLLITQSLMWPRSNVWLDNVYLRWPVVRVVQACCELALRATNAPLATDVQDQQELENQIGQMVVRYTPSNLAGQVRFAVVEDLLTRIASATSASPRLERV